MGTLMERSNEGVKILVCNNLHGRWTQLFDKVATLQSQKGTFAALFCLGAFFPVEEDSELEQDILRYISGKTRGLLSFTILLFPHFVHSAPINTYFV
jgi:hypothetical protein